MVGVDADLAAVLSRLLRAERLDVEVAYVPRRRTPATRIYRLAAGRRAARRAVSGSAGRVAADPRRDRLGDRGPRRTGWRPTIGTPLHGEAVVDDTQLFDGDVAGVRIEPTLAMPGLRASVDGVRRIGAAGSPGEPSSWAAPVSWWCVTASPQPAAHGGRRSTATSKAGYRFGSFMR